MNGFDDIIAAAARMKGFEHPWFVSGGWAIDLFLGRVTREHGDCEIGIFRHDQLALQNHLADRAFFKVVSKGDRGEWVAWDNGEYLELPVHQLLARDATSSAPSSEEDRLPGEVEFFLNDARGGRWVCRRNETITRPISEIWQTSQLGIPILRPEIQLLFKAKYLRKKDQRDFEETIPLLSDRQRAWLKESIQICYGEHAWHGKL